MLTILGGIPGVGKSRFVQTYAEALGLQYGERVGLDSNFAIVSRTT